MNSLNGKFKAPFFPDTHGSIEWLETNNAGAYASSSIIELNNRKYHGLLVAPVEGFEGRFHILSSVDIILNSREPILTGITRYPGAFYPEGWRALDEAVLLPFPHWVYKNSSCSLKKEVFMRREESAVWIVYTLEDGDAVVNADLKFLFSCRNSHNLTFENSSINRTAVQSGDSLTIAPYTGFPSTEIRFSGEWEYEEGFYWDKNICYIDEKDRGLEWIEDRFVPGTVSIVLKKGVPFVIKVGIVGAGKACGDLLDCYRKETASRYKGYSEPESSIELLRRQSAHFLLRNPSGKNSINAGYPWFGEWGRDTMIALPGLTFYSGKTEQGIRILSDYISMIKDGLLPNTLGDTQGFTSYNSIDAGLLFCWAINKLIDFGYGRNNDEKAVLTGRFLPAVRAVAGAFIENRVEHAELDSDGLVYSGSPDTQLTWMDATAWGRPVTPRYGYAVELNALWYDALKLIESLDRMAGNKPEKNIANRIEAFPEKFTEKFWLNDYGYLSDTVNEFGPDMKIRPNMLFASSARNGLLDLEKRKAVAAAAEKYLLTDMGLRTLAPGDPDFAEFYSGGPDERDSKYHQGTVWPWPLGIMVETSLLVSENQEKTRNFWGNYINNFLSVHLFRDGWGSVSEIFDGLAPGTGKGCFAQAWSCGEILRAAEIIKRERN